MRNGGAHFVFIEHGIQSVRAHQPKIMPSSHLCVNYFGVSKIALHGFCTESARFQSCTLVATGAKSAF